MTIRRAERQRTTFHTPQPTPRHRAEPSETEKQIAFLVAGMESLLRRTNPMAQAQAQAEQQEIARKFYNTYDL